MLQIALFALIVVAAAAGYRRLPPGARSELARSVRHVRLRTGNYGLRLLMQRMVDEMLASVLPSITRSYVPNEMTFGLHPVDAQRWGGYFDRLADELHAAMIREISARDDLHLGGAGLTITLVEDAAAAPGRPSFVAQMRRTPPEPVRPAPATTGNRQGRAGPDVHDGATALAPDGAATQRATEQRATIWSLQIEDQPEVVVAGEIIVGRGREAQVRILDEGISREHARLVLLDHRVTLVDLGSTNGTYVNGERVEMAMLENGDTIRLGRSAVATLRSRTA